MQIFDEENINKLALRKFDKQNNIQRNSSKIFNLTSVGFTVCDLLIYACM